MRKTIIAVFDDASTAHHLVNELVNAGIPRSDIGLAIHDPDSLGQKALQGDRSPAGEGDVGAGEGAAFGALVGGLTGLLISAGALMIPGVGPIIAAGPLASALLGTGIGAGAGALTGGLVAGLVDLGVPHEEAGMYAEAVRRGSTLVTVTVHEHEADRVLQMVRQHNPINMDERVTQWRAHGWADFDENVDPYTAEDLSKERQSYRSTSGAGASIDYTPRTYSTGFDMYYDRFHDHYNQTMAGSNYTYEQCMPAYRQGYYMGMDPAYRTRTWDQVEPDARAAWQRSYPDTPWEDFKAMVRHAWEQVKDAVGAED